MGAVFLSNAFGMRFKTIGNNNIKVHLKVSGRLKLNLLSSMSIIIIIILCIAVDVKWMFQLLR